MAKMKAEHLAQYIDHTLLKATATQSDIELLCEEAMTWGFYSVCLQPRWLPFAVKKLRGSQVLPITVVGFPLGANSAFIKKEETKRAIENGALEIDTVVDLGAYLSGSKNEVLDDIVGVVEQAGKNPVKVILETCYLTSAQIIELCHICVQAGVAYVKTSTGFGSAGATTEHVKLMKEAVGEKALVKASGGIRSLASALAMIDAGASRLGTSVSVPIIKELG